MSCAPPSSCAADPFTSARWSVSDMNEYLMQSLPSSGQDPPDQQGQMEDVWDDV